MHLLNLLLFLVTLLHRSNGLYDSNSAVIDVNDVTFDQEVEKHDGVVLVEFYAPWCVNCKNLALEYDKAASNLKGITKVVAVDATQSKSIVSRYNVQHYPTIKVFGADKSKPEDYQGPRTADGITSEVIQKVNRVVKALRVGGGRAGFRRGSSTHSPDRDVKKMRKGKECGYVLIIIGAVFLTLIMVGLCKTYIFDRRYEVFQYIFRGRYGRIFVLPTVEDDIISDTSGSYGYHQSETDIQGHFHRRNRKNNHDKAATKIQAMERENSLRRKINHKHK